MKGISSFLILLMALSLILGVSCKKKTTIMGSAITINDGEPLTGYTVNLLETEIPLKPFSPISVRVLESTTLDAHGEFVFEAELNRRSRFEYSIKVDTRDMYFPDYSSNLDGEIQTEVKLENEKVQNAHIKLAAGAYLRILLFNDNPFDQSDSVTVFLDNGIYKDQYAVFRGFETENYNFQLQYAAPLTTLSGDIAIEWHVKRNGQTTVFYDTVFIPQSKYGSEYYNDAFVYEVHY
jgi:hypothetical protein